MATSTPSVLRCAFVRCRQGERGRKSPPLERLTKPGSLLPRPLQEFAKASSLIGGECRGLDLDWKRARLAEFHRYGGSKRGDARNRRYDDLANVRVQEGAKSLGRGWCEPEYCALGRHLRCLNVRGREIDTNVGGPFGRRAEHRLAVDKGSVPDPRPAPLADPRGHLTSEIGPGRSHPYGRPESHINGSWLRRYRPHVARCANVLARITEFHEDVISDLQRIRAARVRGRHLMLARIR